MAVQGCLRLPKAALTSRELHEGCPTIHKMCQYVPTRGLVWYIDDISDTIENEADDDDLRRMLKEDYTLPRDEDDHEKEKREIVSWMH